MEYFAKIPQIDMTNNQLADLESKIVNTLNFNLTVPTYSNWMNVYLHDFDKFLKSMGLNEYRYMNHNASSFNMYKLA